MDKRDLNILHQLIDYCEDVEKSIVRFGLKFDIFVRDTDYFYSVSMAIMQIGELSLKLSEHFRDQTQAQIPWNVIRSMRNRFAHGYGEMDVETIWETATIDIPKLKLFCENVINESV